MNLRDKYLHTMESAWARRGVALMGVCNVTPDSFSDGGRFVLEGDARARIDQLLGEGADVVDVGGESTKPGAPAVDTATQLERVLPAVRHAVARGACVSVDTADPAVAEACFAAGAHGVNDASCLRDDDLARVTAKAGGFFALMHARGPQEAMAGFGAYPEEGYGDVVADVLAEWRMAAARAMAAGLAREALVMDPGLGFSKSTRHSATLLQRLPVLVEALAQGPTRVPVLIGASRKSFLARVDESAAPAERLGASIGAAVVAARGGARLLRVHDVRATRQAIDVDRWLGERKEGVAHA